MSPPRSLAELVRHRREQLGFSLREVDAKTDALGHRVSYSTINDLEMGQRTNVPDETLTVIAQALRMGVTEIPARTWAPGSCAAAVRAACTCCRDSTARSARSSRPSSKHC